MTTKHDLNGKLADVLKILGVGDLTATNVYCDTSGLDLSDPHVEAHVKLEVGNPSPKGQVATLRWEIRGSELMRCVQVLRELQKLT